MFLFTGKSHCCLYGKVTNALFTLLLAKTIYPKENYLYLPKNQHIHNYTIIDMQTKNRLYHLK